MVVKYYLSLYLDCEPMIFGLSSGIDYDRHLVPDRAHTG